MYSGGAIVEELRNFGNMKASLPDVSEPQIDFLEFF